MSKDELVFVSFKKDQERFIAYISMQQFLSSDRDIEPVLKEAAQLYEQYIVKMISVVAEIDRFRTNRILLPARIVWELGNIIFEFVDALSRLSLQIDDIYGHLVSDLHVKRKWLEKVIILRRYLPNQYDIPESLNWGKCEKGTRRIAEKLRSGIIPD